MKDPEYIMWHHTDCRPDKTCEEIDDEARRGKLHDARIRFFPYDYAITPDGTRHSGAKFGRSIKTNGAHCPGYNGHGKTPRAISIALIGSFNEHKPPIAQYAEACQLTIELSHDHRIPNHKLIGHGEVRSTDCPGDKIDMPSVRNELAFTMYPAKKEV